MFVYHLQLPLLYSLPNERKIKTVLSGIKERISKHFLHFEGLLPVFRGTIPIKSWIEIHNITYIHTLHFSQQRCCDFHRNYANLLDR